MDSTIPDELDIDGIEGLAAVLDELLALPPDEFTQARNAAAKRLRAEGSRAAADAVKRVPRPPLALWALNRVAHEQPALIESLLEAADQLREAYRSGGDIRAATTPERAAEAGVVDAAGGIARARGMNVSDAVVERLRHTVHAAAVDADTAAALRNGRLLREPEAPSLDALLGSLPQPPRATRPPADDARRLALRKQIAAAEKDAEHARADDRAAADAARAARSAWERARGLADEASQHNEAAAERVRDLQRQLDES